MGIRELTWKGYLIWVIKVTKSFPAGRIGKDIDAEGIASEKAWRHEKTSLGERKKCSN